MRARTEGSALANRCELRDYCRFMSIPPLKRTHVEAALARIERDGVPKRRASTKFQLFAHGRYYPPKYVISLAVTEVTGRELHAEGFSGGEQTNKVLQSLGFTIRGPVAAKQNSPRSADGVRYTGPLSSRPVIARVVVSGRPRHSSPRAAREMLLEAFATWPTSSVAKFTVTPGGFVAGDFPSRWSGGRGWHSTPDDFEELVRAAKPRVEECVTRRVLAMAKKRTRVLTVGVDLTGDDEHAELIAVIDCRSGRIVRWTGKSYPTCYQEARLVQVSDLQSHFIEIAGERVLVLGCHDLNMFSARARANQRHDGARHHRCEAFTRATTRYKPSIVLQHSHATDTPNIWRIAWACLARDFPSVRVYASGIAYFNHKRGPRSSLRKVLDGTRSEDGVIDIVVDAR